MVDKTPSTSTPASRDESTDLLIQECLELSKHIQRIHPEHFTDATKVAWLQKEFSELAKRHVDLIYHASHLQWQVIQLARENSRRS